MAASLIEADRRERASAEGDDGVRSFKRRVKELTGAFTGADPGDLSGADDTCIILLRVAMYERVARELQPWQRRRIGTQKKTTMFGVC